MAVGIPSRRIHLRTLLRFYLSETYASRARGVTSRELLGRPRPPVARALQSRSMTPRYYSTKAEFSTLTETMDTEAERPRPAEIRGLSGRQYEIERVLQDKGSLLGRVFLAT